ncbi:nucleotidyltransferase family protein [Rhizobacter sp. J219]|jgi:MurNAc alpha-1-phosphate uridylyltransferase|uniref:N-acetylmuramate alpha-1-phosphate uridylyltransferase MurU n=1 Tax=Rhizobacter sp. J219 TaxID=2898430 RepID=UPI002150D26F|nr:nucleotidyltransferase family protein [Rhizobacter sp. J219]MCR5885031.1 nucleotidyltransferase family protein [Rhizobacter sp. J219]
MKALILAAGRGERMRPLTDHTPKPLLQVRGKPLIVWHLEALARDGIREVVINTAWLEERIVEALGDGSRHGVAIRYSLEGRDHGGALETAGGIAKALPLLTDATNDCFWVVSGDVFLPGFRFDPAAAQRFAQGRALAHLWLVPNAPHHPEGDFGLDAQGLASRTATPKRTWASVGLFRNTIVRDVKVGDKLPLTPLLRAGADAGRIEATAYDGPWTDVGTVERLNALNGEA